MVPMGSLEFIVRAPPSRRQPTPGPCARSTGSVACPYVLPDVNDRGRREGAGPGRRAGLLVAVAVVGSAVVVGVPVAPAALRDPAARGRAPGRGLGGGLRLGSALRVGGRRGLRGGLRRGRHRRRRWRR